MQVKNVQTNVLSEETLSAVFKIQIILRLPLQSDFILEMCRIVKLIYEHKVALILLNMIPGTSFIWYLIGWS